MRIWPSLAAALLLSLPAFAQSADPVAETEKNVQVLRQRADALKAALAGDVCADRAASEALLKATIPTSAKGEAAIQPDTSPKPEPAAKPDTGPEAAPLSRKDLVERLHKAVVLVIAEHDTGSGFFVTPDIVVTNNHVVESATSGEVVVVGRGLAAPMKAKVLARTRSKGQNERDYAILRVEGAHADTTLALGMDLGELAHVVAAGFPGLLLDTDMNFRALIRGDMKAMPDLAMSQGAIMALQNRDRGMPVIAHSAPISGGNSGGPLVDLCGRAIGINTFINVAVQQASSAGFALPSNDLLAYLKENGVTQAATATGGCASK